MSREEGWIETKLGRIFQANDHKAGSDVGSCSCLVVVNQNKENVLVRIIT